jgi:hypothetical protein
MFLPNSGLTLRQIDETIIELRKILQDECCVNDFKSHLVALELELHLNYSIYDVVCQKLNLTNDQMCRSKHILAKIAKEFVKHIPQEWERLRANVSIVYQYLENHGVMNGYKLEKLQYSLDTVTGRSKTLGFNIQGTGDDSDIRPINKDNEIYVHFDWIAADFRMASFMSKDKNMEQSYKVSDPYGYVSSFLNDPNFSRDQVKLRMLKAFYSLNFDDHIFDMFPTLQKDMSNREKFLDNNKFTVSLFDRKFKFNNDNKLSVFNAQFQGSVVHAMQAALLIWYERFPTYLLTEVHDSVIVCCPEKMVQYIIEQGVKIMTRPLDSWIDPAPFMPVKVSIGRKWRKWKTLRVYREA